MLFFTADPHFGHANIIRYCNRPFAGPDEMDAALTANWNARVGADDDVYILGDLTLKGLPYAVDYLRALNGHKHLILGNHDLYVNEGQAQKRLQQVVDEICQYKELHASSGHTYVLMHYPLMFWNGCMNDKVIHLYGHIHNNAYCNSQTDLLLNALNVGVDLHDYTPLSEAEVLSKVETHNASLSHSINGDAPKEGPLRPDKRFIR